MRHTFLLATLALISLLSAGCSSHSIRQGYWNLRIDGQDSRTRENLSEYSELAKVFLVDVIVEEATEEPGEVVEVHPSALKTAKGIKRNPKLAPMYGFIPEGENKIVFDGGDKSWVFKLVGKVLTPEMIQGTFLARMRHEDEAIEGRFSMEWRDE